MKVTDNLRKSFFINYGIMNGWGPERYRKYKIARKLHERDVKEHPELHDNHNLCEHRHPRYRCGSAMECSCGISYEVWSD